MLLLVGSAIYAPLNYHLVTYKSKWHVVEKENLGWDNTYLNLDKHPTRWVTVVGSSSTLRAYFLKNYRSSATKELRNSSRSLWNRVKRNVSENIKDGTKWLGKEGPGLLKKGANSVKSGFNKIKKKGKEMIEKN